MSIWNKILIGLIFIASVAFFYMAARTLKTHQYWKSVAQGYVFLIGVQEEFADACKNGDTSENGGRLALLPQDAGEDDSDTNELRQIARDGKCDLAAMERRIQVIEEKTPGTDRTRFEVSCLTQERGRAWYSCTPQAGADGAVRVVVSETEAHGITLNSEIFVFEEWPLTRDGDGVASGGRYLGEFVVTAVDEENQVWIDLKPVMKPTAEEQKLIDASVAGTVPWINDAGTVTWALYARMPLDDHEIFVEMSDEDLAILMPTDTLSEYTHDGDEAAQTDLDQWAVEGKIEKGKTFGRFATTGRDSSTTTSNVRSLSTRWRRPSATQHSPWPPRSRPRRNEISAAPRWRCSSSGSRNTSESGTQPRHISTCSRWRPTISRSRSTRSVWLTGPLRLELPRRRKRLPSRSRLGPGGWLGLPAAEIDRRALYLRPR